MDVPPILNYIFCFTHDRDFYISFILNMILPSYIFIHSTHYVLDIVET